MNIVCIIPARGGSKGIPKKNTVDFCGQPLISWTIQQALNSKLITSTYVTSDDLFILDICQQFGSQSIKRPVDISGDLATSESALTHAVEFLENLYKTTGDYDGNYRQIDLIVFLQATSPLRRSIDIDNAIETFIGEGLDSLFSAVEMPDFCIWQERLRISSTGSFELMSINYDHKNRKRRQDSEKQYIENGSIYIFKPSILKGYNNRLGGKIGMYLMPQWTMHEIDDMEGLSLCEYYMRKNILPGINIGYGK